MELMSDPLGEKWRREDSILLSGMEEWKMVQEC